jgi:uncharacterized protein (TIGR02217 family)
MTGFHDVLFPIDIAFGSHGGPQRRTEIVTLGSGREERNQRWFNSRRRYNAGYGVKSLEAIAEVTEFFEERRGKLYGFRWRDRSDFKSCSPAVAPDPNDQLLGSGDGMANAFQLRKRYGVTYDPYFRDITKPVDGSVRVSVDGLELFGPAFTCDATSGLVTFASPPQPGASIRAGFLFDVPVRFDTDYLEIDLAGFEAGDIPSLPIVEILA